MASKGSKSVEVVSSHHKIVDVMLARDGSNFVEWKFLVKVNAKRLGKEAHFTEPYQNKENATKLWITDDGRLYKEYDETVQFITRVDKEKDQVGEKAILKEVMEVQEYVDNRATTTISTPSKFAHIASQVGDFATPHLKRRTLSEVIPQHVFLLPLIARSLTQDLLTWKITGSGSESNGLLLLDEVVVALPSAGASIACCNDLAHFQLHCQLGHPSLSVLKKMHVDLTSLPSLPYETCEFAKHHHLPCV
ncbi:Uncharacterized protein TCM_014244 [Theobroma cacao]|uniref:GAG-pre-integrase domain-containing protein n=1 Tax=Theobroma cacao TaxID=3641 RepID=A0A061FXR0_THECC|nr:Uncharacterized protein TCM_014244 [Theobroma cacao]